jgi:hypothetical protein
MLNLEGQGRSELEDKVNLRWWHEIPKKAPLDALIAKLMATTSKCVVSQLGRTGNQERVQNSLG